VNSNLPQTLTQLVTQMIARFRKKDRRLREILSWMRAELREDPENLSQELRALMGGYFQEEARSLRKKMDAILRPRSDSRKSSHTRSRSRSATTAPRTTTSRSKRPKSFRPGSPRRTWADRAPRPEQQPAAHLPAARAMRGAAAAGRRATRSASRQRGIEHCAWTSGSAAESEHCARASSSAAEAEHRAGLQAPRGAEQFSRALRAAASVEQRARASASAAQASSARGFSLRRDGRATPSSSPCRSAGERFPPSHRPRRRAKPARRGFEKRRGTSGLRRPARRRATARSRTDDRRQICVLGHLGEGGMGVVYRVGMS